MKTTKKVAIFLFAAAFCLTACARDREAFSSATGGSSSNSASVAPISQAAPSDSDEQSSEASDDRILSETAADQLRSGSYYIDCTAVIEIEGMRLENAMTVAVDKGNSAIRTTSDISGALTSTRVIKLDGVTWMVNDTSKSCVKVNPDEMSGGFDIDFSELTFEEKGEGSFDKKTLPYEQYDQQGDTIRFFFDENDRLCGLTRTIEDEQLAEMTLRIHAISGNIPAKTIALPEGYSVAQ